MNISCEIICDLLPLYVDGVCSDGSKDLVENHLRDCERCRESMRLMSGEEMSILAEEVNTAQAAGKAWKKGRLRAVLLGLLTAAVLFGAVYGLTVPNIVPVDERYLQVDDVIYYYEDGSITVKLTILDGKKHNYIRYRQVDDAFYITPMRSIIATREDPDWVEKKNRGTHHIGQAAVGKALYVGWGEDAILVWDESRLENKELRDSIAHLEEQIRQP